MTVTIHPRFCSTSRGALRFYGMSFAHLSCHKSCFIAGLSILIYHPDFPKTCFGAGIRGRSFYKPPVQCGENKIKFINGLSFNLEET